MRIRTLALDIATCVGWAVLEDSHLTAHGALQTPIPTEKLTYPFDLHRRAHLAAACVAGLVRQHQPHRVVVEDTNIGGRASGRSQRFLEWFHAALITKLLEDMDDSSIHYLTTRQWHSAIGLKLTDQDKENNKTLTKLRASLKKRLGRKPTPKELSDAKTAAGLAGKRTIKHAAVEWANAKYGLKLTATQDDIADAIGQGTAFITLNP